MKFKVIIFILSFLVVSSCSITKTYFKHGEIKTKKYIFFKWEINKNYNQTGKLVTTEKSKNKNIKRKLNDGIFVKEKVQFSVLTGFYKEGNKKKKYKIKSIETFKGYIYKIEFTQYNWEHHKTKRIFYEHFNKNVPVFKVITGKNKELKFDADTLLLYIDKVISNKKINL